MIATVVGLAILTAAFKGAGTIVRVPDGLAQRLGGLAPALLAALVVTELTNADGVPVPDEKAAGVLAALVLAWRKAPFALCVVAGAAVAAVLRLAT